MSGKAKEDVKVFCPMCGRLIHIHNGRYDNHNNTGSSSIRCNASGAPVQVDAHPELTTTQEPAAQKI